MCDLEALLPGQSHWHLLLARCSTTAAVASLPERSCQVIPAPGPHNRIRLKAQIRRDSSSYCSQSTRPRAEA